MHHLNKHMDYRNICDSQKRRSKKEPSETETWCVLSKTASATFKKQNKKQQQKTVTIPFLAIATNQSLFKFTRKGSYKTPGFPKHIHIHIYTL